MSAIEREVMLLISDACFIMAGIVIGYVIIPVILELRKHRK